MATTTLLSVVSFAGGQIVNAADNPVSTINTTQKKTKTVELSQDTVDKFNQYVSVKNNQYVLSTQVNNIFPQDEISTVKNMIDTSNKEVKNNNEIIDPESKEILTVNNSPFVILAAYHRNYTTKRFWWGKRYYFTSNIAVTRGARYFRHIGSIANNGSIFLSALADSIGYAYPYATIAANVASLGVTYVANKYYGAASALVKYNNKHRRHQIYLDMNRTFQYSLHILK